MNSAAKCSISAFSNAQFIHVEAPFGAAEQQVEGRPVA